MRTLVMAAVIHEQVAIDAQAQGALEEAASPIVGSEANDILAVMSNGTGETVHTVNLVVSGALAFQTSLPSPGQLSRLLLPI
jgi:hypothetical protein